MPTTASATGLALHIGADVLTNERHARWPQARFCRDTVARVSRLCEAAGIHEQLVLLGEQATRARVRDEIAVAVARLDPDGLLVLTFAGHSERDKVEPDETSWCLHDGGLSVRAVSALLADLPATARVIVVSDTCYAAALGQHVATAATVVLLAACGEDQCVLMLPRSDFVVRLESLVLPDGARNPSCGTFAWLHEELQKDVPDVEMPRVWTNHAAAWTHRPFYLREEHAHG